ncbi:MAG: hypothetical protein KBB32_04795 [Spirochaetia bacterium]|nr:hypothetical protein [Spirochaetia bacterium]
MERNRRLSRIGMAVCAATLMAAAGCSGKPSFEGLLALIDAGAPSVNQGTFMRAAELCESTVDRLRLLKRAAVRGPAFASDLALSLRFDAETEPSVALAAYSFHLDTGKYAEAAALVNRGVPYEPWPALAAELALRALADGQLPKLSTAALIAAADFTSHPDFMILAALEAMRSGRPEEARELARAAISGGGAPEADVLWDCGLLDPLALSALDISNPDKLELAAQAAWLSGHVALAAEAYGALVSSAPHYSYRPYAALARLSAADHTAAGRAPQAVHNQLRTFWVEAMCSAFPGHTAAGFEYASHLIHEGRLDQARAVLDTLRPGDAPEAARLYALRAAAEPRLSARYGQELALAFPDNAVAMDTALALAVYAGDWEGYRAVRDSARKLSGMERDVFWDALDAVMTGDLEGASGILRARHADVPDFWAAYDLGLVELARGLAKQAAEAFSAAASKASDTAQKAEVLARAGSAYGFAGDRVMAKAAYKAAISADPTCVDAIRGLSGLEGTSP